MAHNKEVLMKRTIHIALIFAIVTALVPFVGAQTISIGLKKEKTVAQTGLRIKFLEMVEDSRCPTDVNCVWAGNAKIRIQVRDSHGSPKTLELNSTLNPQVVNYGRYEMRLSGLTPRPTSNRKIDKNGYVATIDVRKLVK